MSIVWRIGVGLACGAALWVGTAVRAAAVCMPVTSKQEQGHPTARGYAESGATYAARGYPDCAVKMYQAARNLEPGNAEWVVGLAGAYEQAGETNRAGETLVGAVRAMPSSARLTGALVLFLAQHGQFDNAYEVAEKFAKLHPRDAEAQKVYLRVLVATNDAATSRPLARRLLTAAPHDSELLYLNGLLERKAGEFPAAREHLGQAIALTPKYADSHLNLGLVLARLDDAAGAKQQFAKAIALGIGDPAAHLDLSKALRALGETQQADEQLQLYQQAIKANTDKQVAASKSAEAAQALEKGDAAQAVALYREALEAAPGDAKLAYELALALEKTGDTAGERAALEQAVKLNPAQAPTRYQLGYVLSRMGENDAAEEQFRLAVRTDPGFTQAWISLAATLAMKAKFSEAREAVGHALKLDPRNEEALQMRRMLLASQMPH